MKPKATPIVQGGIRIGVSINRDQLMPFQLDLLGEFCESIRGTRWNYWVSPFERVLSICQSAPSNIIEYVTLEPNRIRGLRANSVIIDYDDWGQG